MKNFARIIDLGTAECCVHRRGSHELVFDFWLRTSGEIISPSAIKTYDAQWLLDGIFSGGYEDVLADACKQVLDTVLHQLDLHTESLQHNVEFSIDGATLDKIYRADAD